MKFLLEQSGKKPVIENKNIACTKRRRMATQAQRMPFLLIILIPLVHSIGTRPCCHRPPHVHSEPDVINTKHEASRAVLVERANVMLCVVLWAVIWQLNSKVSRSE